MDNHVTTPRDPLASQSPFASNFATMGPFPVAERSLSPASPERQSCSSSPSSPFLSTISAALSPVSPSESQCATLPVTSNVTILSTHINMNNNSILSSTTSPTVRRCSPVRKSLLPPVDVDGDTAICRICHCDEDDLLSSVVVTAPDSSAISSDELEAKWKKGATQLANNNSLSSGLTGTTELLNASHLLSASSHSALRSSLPQSTPMAISIGTERKDSVSSPTLSSDKKKRSLLEPTSLQLISPCQCAGSLRWVHHYCLQQWIRSSNHAKCELCKAAFKMKTTYKPIYKWERLEMSASERKKLIFNLIFNLISMFCVFWSIYVLIERATVEAKYYPLDWPFWTKMLVVSIGFLGGVIFLIVQLRLYLSIFLRWRQFNREIVIEGIPRSSTLALPLPLATSSPSKPRAVNLINSLYSNKGETSTPTQTSSKTNSLSAISTETSDGSSSSCTNIMTPIEGGSHEKREVQVVMDDVVRLERDELAK